VLRNQILTGPAILGTAMPNLSASNLASIPQLPRRAGTVQSRGAPVTFNLRAQGMEDFRQGYDRYLANTHNVKYI
jgi:hypothetical protein